MKISAIIAIILSLSAGIIPALSLVSKSKFESTFMTTEQNLKRYFFILLSASIYLGGLSSLFYVVISYFNVDFKYVSINWSNAGFFGLFIFIISFSFSALYAKSISNFFIKEKTVYKVCLDDLGELYIIKMLDHQTCICSYNVHADLDSLDSQIYLIKMEDLLKLPLSEEVVTKEPRSFLQKLFD